MRKFEYNAMFSKISEAEKGNHWEIFQDCRRKVLNIQKEFEVQVSDLESLSYNRWTIRAGGQNLRSRQLSEIRTLCALLNKSNLHGNNGLVLDETNLQNAKSYIHQNRQALAKIFNIKPHHNDLEAPHD